MCSPSATSAPRSWTARSPACPTAARRPTTKPSSYGPESTLGTMTPPALGKCSPGDRVPRPLRVPAIARSRMLTLPRLPRR